MFHKKPSATFKNFNLRLIKQKTQKKIIKNMKNCTILSPKTPNNDLLTLNWGHPSSRNTLSTWRTTNVHFGPLMKLNARWALPVYPVLKDQSHWKICEHNLKKNTAPQYNSNSLNCNRTAITAACNCCCVY